MSVKSTRLRFLTAPDLLTLTTFLERLPFKVEIKGQPVKEGKKWTLFFVIPDHVKWDSVDVTNGNKQGR